jgi:hypothetical protein
MDSAVEQIRPAEIEEPEAREEYENLCASDYMRVLTETNDVRIEEELMRPRVEIWADDFEWQQWASRHQQRRGGLTCHLTSMRSSPFCAFGYH